LLTGILAWRREDFLEAVEALSPLATQATTARNGLAAAIAGRCWRQLGDPGQAGEHRQRARRVLEQLVRPGDLGWAILYDTGHATLGVNEEWLPVAELILACREAQQQIEGDKTTPEMDAAYLTAARERWRPIRTLLYQFDNLARQGDLPGAHRSLTHAIRKKHFAWAAALQSWPDLDKKAAALFGGAGDSSGYAGFQAWATTHGLAGWRFSPRSVLLHPEALTTTAVQSVLASARMDFQAHEELKDPQPWQRPWLALEMGFAEYRAGNWEAALAALEMAGTGYHLACSGSAHAVSALVFWNIGQEAPALEQLAAAEAKLRELLVGNPSGFGRRWEDCVLFQLLLREAQVTLPTNPGSAPAARPLF
jgi:tetratricopeptide (TPR) repeat protein